MATTVGDLMANLWSVGFPAFLTFAFVSAITYGLLRKVRLFDDDTVDGTVALVAGFMSVWGVLQYTGGTEVFSWFFGFLTIAVVFLLGFALLLGMMGVDVADVMNESHKYQRRAAYIAGIVLAGVISFVLSGFYGVDVGSMATSDQSLAAVMLIGMLVVVYYIARDSETHG